MSHNRADSPRHPLSDLAAARRLGRHEPRSGLLGRLRRAAHRRARPGGPRPDLHHRARQRAVRRGVRGAGAAGGGQDARVVHRGHGRRSGGRSPATASCAGSGPRRGSSTWPPPRSSTRSGICGRRPRASRSGSCSADMTPEADRLAASTSATSPTRSPPTKRSDMLRSAGTDARRERDRRDASATAIPAYTTSAGWLGYPDDKLRRLCREAIAAGLARTSRSRSAATSRTTSAAAAIIREEIGCGPRG